MTISLFSPNLVIVFAMAYAALAVYLLGPSLHAVTDKKTPATKKLKKVELELIQAAAKTRKEQAIAFTTSAISVAALAQLVLNHNYAGEKLPTIFFMILPLTMSVAIMAWSWKRSRRDRAVSGLLIFCSLIFGLLLANNYYHYYPSLSDALNLNKRTTLKAATHSASVHFTVGSGSKQPSLEQTVQHLAALPSTGKVYSITIPGTQSHFVARAGWVYAPPIAFGPQKIDLPIIVMLAGTPGSPQDWLNGSNVEATLNAFAAQHHGVTPLVVGVDDLGSTFNDTECVNSSRGNAETYLTVDVPTFIKQNFDVSSNPANWAIGGLSDGGMCGAMLTLRHPDLFHTFFDFGGTLGPDIGSQEATIADLFGDSTADWQLHQPLYLLQHKDYKSDDLGGFFAVGKSDSPDTIDAVHTLYQQTREKKMDVTFEATDGAHTFDVWAQHFHDALPWLSARLGATK